MRLLVTGGAGFVGSTVCLRLRERHPDWEIVALDNLYRRGSELNLPRLRAAGVRFVHADVRQPGDLALAGPFDAMVESSAEPSATASGDAVVPVNLLGAYHCFEAARAHGAQVVFLSTSRVYPFVALNALVYRETETRFELVGLDGIAEDFPLAGARTMYGASKLAAEYLLMEYDVDWVVNRCGVIAGPWQMGKVDQGVFTHWMASHVLGRPLAYVGYGGTGKQVRDLLHVDDVVDLVERQLLDPAGWRGLTFNVGGGRAGSLSLSETTAICRELAGREVPIGADPDTRPGDVRCYLSDCRALYAHTDWRPTCSPQDVLRDIHTWLSDHGKVVLNVLG